jgi:hypothetical protein
MVVCLVFLFAILLAGFASKFVADKTAPYLAGQTLA